MVKVHFTIMIFDFIYLLTLQLLNIRKIFLIYNILNNFQNKVFILILEEYYRS
jgi:hypothetical protein